jgi:hypothetical protein
VTKHGCGCADIWLPIVLSKDTPAREGLGTVACRDSRNRSHNPQNRWNWHLLDFLYKKYSSMTTSRASHDSITVDPINTDW